MRKLFLLTLLLMVALAAGCSHTDPMVGTWVGTQTSPQGISIKNTWVFTADGKNTMALQATGGRYSGMTISSTGTYTASGGTMTQTIDTVSEPGRTRTIASPVATTIQYTLNGDTLTLSGSGIPGPLVLTRQSSS